MIKSIFNRNIFIYLAVAAVLFLIVDKQRYRSKMINYLTVPVGYLYLVGEGAQKAEPQRILDYVEFYERLIEHAPNAPDALGMLGVSHYYLGDTKKAAELLEKAAAANPHYFWFQYNSGVIYAEEGQREKAAEAFQKALRIKPQLALYFIQTSRILRYVEDQEYIRASLRMPSLNVDGKIEENLKAGYQAAARLTILLQQQKADRNIKLPQELLRVRVF